MSKHQPKIDRFYSGEWTHHPSEGVGLKFTGFPNDIKKFLDLLHDHSCNPVAARRILDELKENGEKLTTLMFSLDFNHIGEELKSLGVEMQVIAPAPTDKINDGKTDSMAFYFVAQNTELSKFNFESEEQKIEVLKKANDFSSSIEQLSHHYGPYEPNAPIPKNRKTTI